LPYGDFENTREARQFPADRRIHFGTADSRILVPSAVALRIHSCIAKILDKIGIAGQLNKILGEDDYFNLRYLSTNGSVNDTTLNNSTLL
jgi:hypothetical protein